eukprot:SAG11_NODE_9317_length_922_cov_1.122722_1_plen_205_part_00
MAAFIPAYPHSLHAGSKAILGPCLNQRDPAAHTRAVGRRSSGGGKCTWIWSVTAAGADIDALCANHGIASFACSAIRTQDKSGFLERPEGEHYLACIGCEEQDRCWYWEDMLRIAVSAANAHRAPPQPTTHAAVAGRSVAERHPWWGRPSRTRTATAGSRGPSSWRTRWRPRNLTPTAASPTPTTSARPPHQRRQAAAATRIVG